MDIHENARLTPRGREHMVNMVLSGQTPKAVSEAVGVCPRTVKKWVERFQADGLAGLQDRSSRPEHLRQPTPQPHPGPGRRRPQAVNVAIAGAHGQIALRLARPALTAASFTSATNR